MKVTFFLIALGFLFAFTLPKNRVENVASTGSLIYKFSNLPSNKGVIRVVLYNTPDKFLTKNEWCRADSAYVHSDGSAEVSISGLPYGKYAAALYLDENQNGVIDRNMVGLPTEAYGFSNNVRAKWSIPGFEKVQFAFQNNTEILSGKVDYWSHQ
jgi:uncharacterized protein (DUF2141 family)